MLDALELDEYWTVCREIQEAEEVNVFHFADALEKFGLCDLAVIAQQAKRRMEFLDYLDRLASDPKTAEQKMHRALQHNLWVSGREYGLMASNEQHQSIIREYADRLFQRFHWPPTLDISDPVAHCLGILAVGGFWLACGQRGDPVVTACKHGICGLGLAWVSLWFRYGFARFSIFSPWSCCADCGGILILPPRRYAARLDDVTRKTFKDFSFGWRRSIAN